MADFIAALGDIVGEKYCLHGDMQRTKYEHDITGAYKGRSLAVVRPKSTAEASRILMLANASGTPVVPISGNTGLAGGAYAAESGDRILLSLDRMNRQPEINPLARTARVQAGVILSDLHDAAASHGLTFPLMFGARGSCMIGGNLATNAGGSNVLRYGNTRALCLGLEAVLASGEVVNLMSALHKDNTGYDLKDLFIGSEGTLGVITSAVVKLVPKPGAFATAMVGMRDIRAALELLHLLQAESGGAVEAFEYMPANYFRHLQQLDPGAKAPFPEPMETGILVELAATGSQSAEPAKDGRIAIAAVLEDSLTHLLESGDVLTASIASSEGQRLEMWRQREMAFEVSTHLGVPVTADIAVPLDAVAPFLEQMEQRLKPVAPKAEVIAIAHLGDGNIHYSLWPDPGEPQAVGAGTREAIYELVEDVVQELGGSFSAEHGIGLAKRGAMGRRKDPAALNLMRQIKTALDPGNILNPGKVLP